MKVLALATLAIVGWTNSAPLDRSDILQAAKEAAERGYEVRFMNLSNLYGRYLHGILNLS